MKSEETFGIPPEVLDQSLRKESIEEMEEAILEIADGMRKLNSTRLKRRVIVLLVKDTTGLSIKNIEKVLNALDKIGDKYLKSVETLDKKIDPGDLDYIPYQPNEE